MWLEHFHVPLGRVDRSDLKAFKPAIQHHLPRCFERCRIGGGQFVPGIEWKFGFLVAHPGNLLVSRGCFRLRRATIGAALDAETAMPAAI